MSCFSKKAIFMPDFPVKSETFRVYDYFEDGKNVLYEGKPDFLMFLMFCSWHKTNMLERCFKCQAVPT